MQKHLFQISEALHFSHSNHIVHCDVKEDNLLTDYSCVKIIEFNLSQFENTLQSDFNAYAWQYRPLEVILQQEKSCKSDMYALGIMFFTLRFRDSVDVIRPIESKHPRYIQNLQLIISSMHFINKFLDIAIKKCCRELPLRCSSADVKADLSGKRNRTSREGSCGTLLITPMQQSFDCMTALFLEYRVGECLVNKTQEYPILFQVGMFLGPKSLSTLNHIFIWCF